MNELLHRIATLIAPVVNDEPYSESLLCKATLPRVRQALMLHRTRERYAAFGKRQRSRATTVYAALPA